MRVWPSRYYSWCSAYRKPGLVPPRMAAPNFEVVGLTHWRVTRKVQPWMRVCLVGYHSWAVACSSHEPGLVPLRIAVPGLLDGQGDNFFRILFHSLLEVWHC